jgi:FtsP/CotA-like multicopper oxidase with cupredoxin domain
MPLQPKTYRFRFVNSAVARPWLLKIKDAWGRDISDRICHIVASDGGWRSPPVPWPAEGLQMSAAERYEAVCDFSLYANQKLYLFNGRNGECVIAWMLLPCSLLECCCVSVCSAVPANCA